MSRTRSIPLAQSARPIRNRASAPLARTSRRASRLPHARSASFLRVRRGSRPSRIPARRPRMLAPPAPSAQRKAPSPASQIGFASASLVQEHLCPRTVFYIVQRYIRNPFAIPFRYSKPVLSADCGLVSHAASTDCANPCPAIAHWPAPINIIRSHRAAQIASRSHSSYSRLDAADPSHLQRAL